MEPYCIKTDILRDLKDEINSINAALWASLKERTDAPSTGEFLCSEEFLKISFSSNILEDITLLDTLSGNPLFKIRHGNMIIRDMVEQVIEFIYLIKNKHLITEYMGMNVADNSSLLNPIKAFRKLTSDRFSGGRKKVAEMAKDIGEKKSREGNLTLYELYQILSEECHNSYYLSNLDIIQEIETREEPMALTKEQVQNLIIVIDRFMNVFRGSVPYSA